MSAATADKPKATGRKKGAAESNGSGTVEEAHAALGTGANIDLGPQDVHDGDELREPDEAPESASGSPVQLGFVVGGKKPTGSQVRIVGGKVEVPGDYKKGQSVEFRVIVKFGEVAFVDLEDKETGQVIGCDRRQKGRIVSIDEVR
jgi:hypothetical protein